MGIAGLLPLLKDIQNETHVEQFRGKTLGVDAYVWLHRGAYACATDLALGRPTTRYVAYATHRIRMLKHYGVTPYVVFDGGPLPSKAGTESERAAKRAEHRARGLALHRQNQSSAARDAFVRSVDITPEMAYELIKVCRAENVAYVVAPYEADAQLAYLERERLIDAIITEDSDLLVFGCQTVLFKLDTYGNCVELQRDRFVHAKQISLDGWGVREFRQMAILSGCDYLPSIVGMGLKNAHRFLRRYESVDNVLRALRLEGKLRVPPRYAEAFRRAEFTFVHQRVWDPRGHGCMTTLTPLPDDVDAALLPCLGAPIAWEVARRIAAGEVCPIAKTPLMGTQGTPMTSPSKSKAQQPSLRAFFGTPRRVLGELDGNRVASAPAPASAPAAARTEAPAPPALETPVPSRFFPPQTDTSLDASSLFDAPSSDDVQTPQTSPHACVSPPAPQEKEAWNEDVSSPASSSPTGSPVRAPPAAATPARRPIDTNDADAEAHADAARRTAWFERFSFSAPRRLDGPARRTLSDTTPTRGRAPIPSTPRLPLAPQTKRPSAPAVCMARSVPPKRPAEALGLHATPARDAPAKRMHVDTPPQGSGSAKLLQFRYREK